MAKIDFSQAVLQSDIDAQAARSDALAYLAATDWYVTRQAETGKAIPDDVAKRRAEARGLI